MWTKFTSLVLHCFSSSFSAKEQGQWISKWNWIVNEELSFLPTQPSSLFCIMVVPGRCFSSNRWRKADKNSWCYPATPSSTLQVNHALWNASQKYKSLVWTWAPGVSNCLSFLGVLTVLTSIFPYICIYIYHYVPRVWAPCLASSRHPGALSSVETLTAQFNLYVNLDSWKQFGGFSCNFPLPRWHTTTHSPFSHLPRMVVWVLGVDFLHCCIYVTVI